MSDIRIDLARFYSRISGNLMELDGPFRDDRGKLVWYAILHGERIKSFRSSARARVMIHAYNAGVITVAKIGEKQYRAERHGTAIMGARALSRAT